MNNSTRRRRPRHHQSAKPYPDFPLTAHPSGRWCKKVRGKIIFFGKIAADDNGQSAQVALDKWLREKDELLAGRTPRAHTDGLALRDLANRYLTFKMHLVETGELSERTFAEYHNTCERLVDLFGKDRLVADLAADDFEKLRASIAKSWGPIRLGNEIQRVRSVFKYGYDADLIERPVKFGPGFRLPSLKTLRTLRAENGPRMFQPNEIQAMLNEADGQLRTMILLGINCGFGNEDVATLRIAALDLAAGWVMHPRPKTGVDRKCKLWPETIADLREVVSERKAPADDHFAPLVFITKHGQSWANGSYGTAITHEMDKLLKQLKLKRRGISFYTLRHTFATIAGESRDQVAVNSIMGHVDPSVAAHYREHISDERLKAVAEHIRQWLFRTNQRKLK